MKVRFVGGRLSILLAASWIVPAYSQRVPDVSAFVDLVNQGTTLANNCSAIANQVVAVPVPGDLNTARAHKAANERSNSSKQLEVSEQSRAYLQQMENFNRQLSSCGKNFSAARVQITRTVKHYHALIEKDAMPRPDAQKVFAALKDFDVANQGMVKAIAALSNDRQVQSLFHKAIVDDFVEEGKK